MTRRDDYLDAMLRHLGAAYYQALHGHGSAAEVTSAVRQVSEAKRDGAEAAATQDVPGSLHRRGRLHVGDVMTTNFITVTEETSYRQVAELQSKHHFTGLPVVNSGGGPGRRCSASGSASTPARQPGSSDVAPTPQPVGRPRRDGRVNGSRDPIGTSAV